MRTRYVESGGALRTPREEAGVWEECREERYDVYLSCADLLKGSKWTDQKGKSTAPQVSEMLGCPLHRQEYAWRLAWPGPSLGEPERYTLDWRSGMNFDLLWWMKKGWCTRKTGLGLLQSGRRLHLPRLGWSLPYDQIGDASSGISPRPPPPLCVLTVRR